MPRLKTEHAQHYLPKSAMTIEIFCNNMTQAWAGTSSLGKCTWKVRSCRPAKSNYQCQPPQPEVENIHITFISFIVWIPIDMMCAAGSRRYRKSKSQVQIKLDFQLRIPSILYVLCFKWACSHFQTLWPALLTFIDQCHRPVLEANSRESASLNLEQLLAIVPKVLAYLQPCARSFLFEKLETEESQPRNLSEHQ